MKEYHKIKTVFLRDPQNKFKTLLEGQYSMPEFQYLANNEWTFTEKVDGTNIRVIWNHETRQISFLGKTDNAQIPPFLLKSLDNLFKPNQFQDYFPEISLCLYGEGYGAKIQKAGSNYRLDQSFVLFDVKINDWWLKREDVEDISRKFNIDVVPIVGYGTLEEMINLVKSRFKSAWSLGEGFIAEGIVARPMIELKTRGGERIITKLKYKDYIGTEDASEMV